MQNTPRAPTLDQLNVLVQVVEAGSFTAAAQKLHRTLSAVSYAVSSLESQLGVSLFDRSSSRSPQITEAGRLVLAEARSVLTSVGSLRAKVAGLQDGLEGELHVVLDCLLPAERVTDALTAFFEVHPSVALHLHMETLGAIAHMVLNRSASVGLSGPFTAQFDELHRVGVGRVRMVAIAGPSHPLAQGGGGGQAPGSVREHVQLVVYDRSKLTQGHEFSVRANRTWRLADLSAKHMLLRAGMGWGMMPLAMVRDDLARGTLVELSLPDLQPFDYPVDAIHRTDSPPGPAARWLIERFRNQPSD